MKIQAGIIGGAGYTGGELIRLLIRHPDVSVSFIYSRSNGGKPVSSVHHDLLGEIKMGFSSELPKKDLEKKADVLFLCMGHGESKKFLEQNKIPDKVRIIDLSNDFRLALNSRVGNRNFVYGLPELNREKIRSADNVANPGCFATTIQLGLLPLGREKLLEEVYTTAITGSTGAGQSLTDTNQFSWRANNVQAYKTLSHQHLNEIHESLHQLQPSFPPEPGGDEGSTINFVPWRGNFTRGIFASSQMHSKWDFKKLVKLYEEFYQDHPYAVVSQEAIYLKQVVNTNKCVIQLEKVGSKLVIHSALDNLLKGASGQAVQNMNLMFGLDECAGLNLKATAF